MNDIQNTFIIVAYFDEKINSFAIYFCLLANNIYKQLTQLNIEIKYSET